ncbi:MAG: hypothetical protein O7E54_13710, partial [Planctomycetota bacterium]|nr:hypothetical protein [Planctomycetota bacterium]
RKRLERSRLKRKGESAYDRAKPEASKKANDGKWTNARKYAGEKEKQAEGMPGGEDADEGDFPVNMTAEDPNADYDVEIAHGASINGRRVARAGGRRTPARPPATKGRKKRPERALLSLDIEFYLSDNVVNLRSLAPGGSVTLSYVNGEVPERRAYFGVLLGAAVGAWLLLRGRPALLRVIPGAVFLVLALHFGGLSIFPPEFAVSAAQAVLVVFLLAIAWRLKTVALFFVRMAKAVYAKIAGWRQARAAAKASLVLLALATPAGAEEILAPYDQKDPDKINQVFLDAKEYHRLRKLAFPEDAGRPTAFARAVYDATLSGEELTLSARYEIVKETEDAEQIPLRLDNTAVVTAKLDGAPAPLAVKKGAYFLALRGKGRSQLELTLRPRLVAKGDTVRFEIPVVPVAGATLRLTHDRAGSEAKVAALGGQKDNFYRLGPVSKLAVAFEPKVEGFKAPAAELRAHTESYASIRDGFTGIAARVRYTISGGTAERLRLKLDPDIVVRTVRCRNLAGWEIDKDGLLTIALTKPASHRLTVELWGERAQKRERTEGVPQVAPLGVLRDAGLIVLDTLPDLKLQILETKGLRRESGRSLRGRLTASHVPGAVHSVYGFSVRPYVLRWRVSLEPSRLRAESHVYMILERDRVFAEVNVRLRLERGPGPFRVDFQVPKGYEVTAVRANGVRDWWRKEDVLAVARSVRHTGTITYTIRLLRTGSTAESFDAPGVWAKDALREGGLLLIGTRAGAGAGLEVETSEPSNLFVEDIARVSARPGVRLVRAYRYVTTPWSVKVKTSEQERDVEAMVVTRIVPLEDRVRVEALVNFYVRSGLVNEIVFRVPVKDKVHVQAPDRREVNYTDVDDGRVYVVSLRTPTRGSASAAVTYSVPLGETVRFVEPIGSGLTRRYVTVEKVADGEVRTSELDQLESGTFRDLPLVPSGTTAETVAGVFVGTGGACSLRIDVKRHAFEEVASAVVNSARAKALVDRSGWVRTHVVYRVYNRTEQFLRLELPERAELYSVFVAGDGVRPLQDGDTILVPLRKLAIGSPTFDVDRVYAYREPELARSDLVVRLPKVKGLDVRRTTISLFLPKGFAYEFET